MTTLGKTPLWVGIGRRVRWLRAIRSMLRKDLAAITKINILTLEKYEKAKIPIPWEEIEVLAQALHIPAHALYGTVEFFTDHVTRQIATLERQSRPGTGK